MKLLDSLYSIVYENVTDAGHDYTIKLDPEHFIYKAHFPGEPITPGVCIMQIAQELLELHTGLQLEVQCVRNVKFLRIIVPTETPVMTYRLQKVTVDGDEAKVMVSVIEGSETYAKLSLACRKTAQA